MASPTAPNFPSEFVEYFSNISNHELYKIDKSYTCQIPLKSTKHIFKNSDNSKSDFILQVQITQTSVSVFLEYVGDNPLGIPILFRVNVLDKDSNIHHTRLSPNDNTIGYNDFIQLPEIPLPNAQIHFQFTTIHDPTHILFHNFNNYDSKLATNCVGLTNQGATCYLNSLLQSLYATKIFYSAVNTIDATHSPIALALQRLFYQLQISPNSIPTTQLTKSFGWHSYESFQQHDVQELLRVLQDNLEEHLKTNNQSNFIQAIFGAQLVSYITTTDPSIVPPFTSNKYEFYYDVQLVIKSNPTLRDAFLDYTIVELLEGDNQYEYPEGSHCNAKKGLLFHSFPKVLHLQLRRFEYDYNRDCNIKLNDFFEYPDEIDLLEFLSEDSPDRLNKDGTTRTALIYTLYSVLVHAGDVNHGHYYAFVKHHPTGNAAPIWLRCDDDHVLYAQHDQVFQDNYGRKDAQMNATTRMSTRARSTSSAYMLVYFRKEAILEITAPVTNIPKSVKNQIEMELQQQKEEEARLAYHNSHATIKVYNEIDTDYTSLLINHPFYPDSKYTALEIDTNQVQSFGDVLNKLDPMVLYYLLTVVNGQWLPLYLINDTPSLVTPIFNNLDHNRSLHLFGVPGRVEDIEDTSRLVIVKWWNSNAELSNCAVKHLEGPLKTALELPLTAVVFDGSFNLVDTSLDLHEILQNDGSILHVSIDEETAIKVREFVNLKMNQIKVTLHTEQDSNEDTVLYSHKNVLLDELMEQISNAVQLDKSRILVYSGNTLINNTNISYAMGSQCVSLVYTVDELNKRQIVVMGEEKEVKITSETMTINDILGQLMVANSAVLCYGVHKNDITEEYALETKMIDIPQYVSLVITRDIPNRIKIIHFEQSLYHKHGTPQYIANAKGKAFKEWKSELFK